MKSNLLINIKDYVRNDEKYFAHTKKGKKNETLKEHLDKTIEYYHKLCEKKQLDIIIKNIVRAINLEKRKLTKEEQEFVYKLIINSIYLHDLGKINIAFQRDKMNNKFNNINDRRITNSEHSLLSSLLYISIFYDEINQIKDYDFRKLAEHIMYINSYNMSRHHGYLKDLEDYKNRLNQLKNNIKKQPNYILDYIGPDVTVLDFKEGSFLGYKRYSENDFYKKYEIYILEKLLYSITVNCDFYATYEYMNDQAINEFGELKDINKLREIYNNTEIYKGIDNYNKYKNKKIEKNPFGENSINTLRSEMFLESEKNLLNNTDKYIFYMEAPTGSGKTNTSINLALNLIDKNKSLKKIFYIFPFNTLIEQTEKTIRDIFNGEDLKDMIKVINSITPMIDESEYKGKEDYSSINFDKKLLDIQMLHYPLIMTSHVNFFRYLFSGSREANLALLHLANSVVIIDEIQSYKNQIWKEIIEFFSKIFKLLNIKVIIMSATLPRLDKLVSEREDIFTELIIDKEKYYKNTFFKDRVKLDFSLLKNLEFKDPETGKEELIKKIKEVWREKQKRILIEFIKKEDARGFYNLAKRKFPDKKVVELTGDDNRIYRKEILDELKDQYENDEFILKDILIVATQVIEAGVDIDVDIGFKDISTMDSEEQFLGRINRSSSREGLAFFFNLTEANKIYRGDLRLNKDLRHEEYQKILLEKEFNIFYEECLKNVENKKEELNENNINNFYLKLRHLDFQSIDKHMDLIKDNKFQVYLPYNIKYKDENEIKEIDGEQVWDEFMEIFQNKELRYAEKRIKLSSVQAKMDYFIFNLNKEPMKYENKIGNLYYVQNGMDYIVDGKFDREKYLNESEDICI